MTAWEFTEGLHDLGSNVYAYLQPDGSWGLSNAGLVVDDREALLIDTLYDVKLTGRMLETINRSLPALGPIRYLVNTHANGDHWFGNELLKNAEIISSKAAAQEMAAFPPEAMAGLMKSAPQMGELGRYLINGFGRYEFDGITATLPTRTFSERLDLAVGRKPVELIEIGPGHTAGDIIVHLPEDAVVFAADLLFIGGAPIMWDGPVKNMIRALDLLIELKPRVIVPGHGPIADISDVKYIRSYWQYIAEQTKRRYEAGMTAGEAAQDIDQGEFANLSEPERIVINVHALYREFSGDESPANVMELFTEMAAFAKRNAAD